jgi:putative ABC transport system permease protein
MSVSLARNTLLYDWRRFTAAIAALSLAGVLMLVQAGLMFGMFDTFTVVIKNARADLWVTSPDVASFDLSIDIPARYEGRFWAHPEVLDVAVMPQSSGNWRRGKIKQTAIIVGLPSHAESAANLTGFTPDLLAVLREPGTVTIDRVDAAKLGVRIGDFAEINSRRVRVAGMVEGYRSAFGAYVFASKPTLRLIGADLSASPFYLLRLRDPARAEAVRDALRPRDAAAPYTIWLAKDLASQSQLYWLLDSGSGVSFAFSGFIALLVGVGVTSQTLRGAILSQLRELAALRALGVSAAKLRGYVIEQAAWIGVTGVAVMLFLTLVLWSIAQWTHVALSFPMWTLALAIVFVFLIALSSSVASVRALYRSQPADLLR